MADGDTAPLFRLEQPATFKRKTRDPKFPPPPDRDRAVHAGTLRQEAAQVTDRFRNAAAKVGNLATEVPYVRIQTSPKTLLSDGELRALGLRPVYRRSDSVIAAYSDTPDLRRFQAGVTRFSGQEKLFWPVAKIDRISAWSIQDRMSERLRERMAAGGTLVVDVILLPTDRQAANPRAVPAIRQFVEREGGTVLDQALDPGFTALRVRMGAQSLGTLLEYRDDIAIADLPPTPRLFYAEAVSLELDHVDVEGPADGAPGICVVDSGIHEEHPLLVKCIITDKSKSYPPELGPAIPPPTRDAAHGTRVAGIAAYGDLRPMVGSKKFASPVWLVNARLLNDNGGLEISRMPFVRAIVADARDRCKIFNLSLGLEICKGSPSPYAVEIDQLTSEYGVLFVVSSGNEQLEKRYENRRPDEPYPDFMSTKDWEVFSPAEALNALTVGGITSDTEFFGLPATARPIGGKMQPSPFSRSGGLKNVLKPDLVDLGGNVAFDDDTDQWVFKDPGLRVTTTGHEFSTGKMLTFDQGTSFAAPKVAHLAALIVARYPEATPNLIRALLVQSARLPEGVSGWKAARSMRLCGFGVPDIDRAIYCRPQRVTYYHEGEITPGQVQIYDIPVPPEIHAAKGKKKLTVTIAYDPPVSLLQASRPRGIVLTWDVARGDVKKEAIEEAIIAAAAKDEEEGEPAKMEKAGEEKKPTSPFMATKMPKRIQSNGTVQKQEYSWRNKGEFGETYKLAVTARAIRPIHAKDRQGYSVVVTLECQDTELNLYTLVRARLQGARVRVRLPSPDASPPTPGS